MNPYHKKLEAWRERRRKMQVLRDAGMTLEAIAKKHGISRQRVLQLLKVGP